MGLRGKLLSLLAAPVIGVLIYSVFLVYTEINEMMALNHFGNFVKFSNVAADLVDNLQVERGYSVGHLASDGKNFGAELTSHRP